MYPSNGICCAVIGRSALSPKAEPECVITEHRQAVLLPPLASYDWALPDAHPYARAEARQGAGIDVRA